MFTTATNHACRLATGPLWSVWLGCDDPDFNLADETPTRCSDGSLLQPIFLPQWRYSIAASSRCQSDSVARNQKLVLLLLRGLRHCRAFGRLECGFWVLVPYWRYFCTGPIHSSICVSLGALCGVPIVAWIGRSRPGRVLHC